MRDVPEWIGKHDNTVIPPRVRLRVFRAFDGVCQCGCGIRIRPGDRWDIEHQHALCNGGQHRETNLRPYLADHHVTKTRDDVAAKAKTDASTRKHFGIKPNRHHGGWRPTFLTNKDQPFKKTFRRGTIRRPQSR